MEDLPHAQGAAVDRPTGDSMGRVRARDPPVHHRLRLREPHRRDTAPEDPAAIRNSPGSRPAARAPALGLLALLRGRDPGRVPDLLRRPRRALRGPRERPGPAGAPHPGRRGALGLLDRAGTLRPEGHTVPHPNRGAATPRPPHPLAHSAGTGLPRADGRRVRGRAGAGDLARPHSRAHRLAPVLPGPLSHQGFLRYARGDLLSRLGGDPELGLPRGRGEREPDPGLLPPLGGHTRPRVPERPRPGPRAAYRVSRRRETRLTCET